MEKIGVSILTDHQAMSLAISEALKGSGFVSPNPQVGCVILDRFGKLLSKGYHKKFGGPHAEIEALVGLSSDQLQGARLFVTLEPCAHEGKTPSCAKALAKLPLAEVIFGLVDPNPLVSGKGAQIIRDAGVKTTEYQGDLKPRLEESCEHFLVNFRYSRPFFSVKVASSLDGQMALKSGESKWITGEAARQRGHYLRATHEGIMIGQGTLMQDNPLLNIRHPDFPEKKNKVIVLVGSSYSKIQLQSLNLLKTRSPDDVYFLENLDEKYIRLHSKDGRTLVRPHDNGPEHFYDKNLRNLGTQQRIVNSVLIEGGAKVISSHIAEMRVDRLYIFQAPILLGANSGRSWTEGVKINSMSEKRSLSGVVVEGLTEDFLITGRLT